jgi:hypothetical protein
VLGDPDLSRNVSHNWRAGVLLNKANAWSSRVYRDVASAEISSVLRNFVAKARSSSRIKLLFGVRQFSRKK